MLRISAVLLAFLIAVNAPAYAQGEARKPLPDHLTFGYDEEGKVDASPAACEAVVKETVEWGPEETKQAIKDVCAARKRHIDAYAAIQKSYKALAKEIEPDHRIDPASAVTAFKAMVEDCIDHKTNLTTGGHNIMIDIIPNDIATACLKIGKGVLDDETYWFTHGGMQVRSSP
jgi:hypothetical protein